GSGTVNLDANYWGEEGVPSDITVNNYIVMNPDGTLKLNGTDETLDIIIKGLNDKTNDQQQPTIIDIIYVSEDGNNDNDGSSASLAVKTIDHAITIAQNGKIIILPGTYTITETLSINKNLNIEARGNVFIKGDVKLIDNSAKLTLTNIKFDSTADVNGAIISSTDDLTIDSSVFNVNTESGSAIYVDGGVVIIRNSVLLNPTGYALTVSTNPSTITSNNNWWGKNDGANTQAEVSSWIVMDANVDLARINAGDEVTITVSFNKTNDGSDYTGTLPEFNITVTANDLNEAVSVKSNNALVKYTVNSDDEATVISGSESLKIPLILYEAPEIIYVDATGGLDTNDGDEAHPVQSIAKAIEIAQKGKIVILEGTYTIDNTLTVNNDLDVTGEGSVIIDGNSKRILTNNANLNITNVQFTNGFDSSAVIVNNANLTLTNTSFYSNVNLNGYGASVVRNNKKLTVVDSKFYENKERYGNIYNNAGVLYINNTEFFNNDVTDVATVATGLAVYSEAGNAKIENSRFYTNKGNFSVIYFKSKDSLGATVINNLTIDNCIFNNNELVRYGVIYSEKANTVIKESTFTNNVVQKSSTANGEGSAIYVTGEKVTVEKSVFMNNNAADSGNDIYVYAGELTISDSVLINSNGYSIEKTDSANVTANDNWWGANTPNTSVDVKRWIIMTVTSNDSEIETGDEITITASFDKTNDGESYTGDLPEVFDVTFISTSGNLNEVKSVEDKKAEVTYTVDESDKELTITSNGASETLKINKILDIIYVDAENGLDTYDGDRDTPVATIQKAIELAQKGQIVVLSGTYKTGDLGIISDNLTITGEGKVVIDAQNSNRILYVGQEANVVLKNLILINGFSSEESGALLGNSNNLTIINCTLTNSTAGENNGGAIYNVGHLTVINSTIANNAARVGGAIYSGSGLAKSPTISIENSIIENNIASGNDANGGGAIFAQQITAIDVKNTTFENNQAQTTASGGAIFVSLSDANINIENSRFIKNHANGKEGYGGGAIYMAGTSNYERKGSLTISNTLFEQNTADTNGGAVYVRATTLKISNSVLIDNTDENGYAIYGYGTEQINPSVNVNTNWWGSNNGPESAVGGYRFTPSVSTWLVLTVSNSSEIKVGETVTLTATINTLNDGSTLANPINIETPITINTNLGSIEGVLTNGEFSYDYTVTEGLKFISASVDDEDQVLFVITTPTTVEIENITANKGDRVEYTIKVTSSDGAVINKGNVQLYFGDELIETFDVLNGEAINTITIAKDIGNYTISAIYVDESEEYGASTGTASLNVTGNNDIVTPENFNNFFDDNGELRDEVPFDELTFKGEFKDLTITLTDSISIKGDGAVFNNTALKITGDEVSVKGIKFVADKEFDENDGALIYIGGDNAVLADNEIVYNAPDNVTSYAITVDIAADVKITGNTISYTAKSNGDVETIAVNAHEANNLIFENNKVDAVIPSAAIGYAHYPDNDYFSQGVNIEDSNNVLVNKNNITVKYSNVAGYDDTIFGLHLIECDDSKITDNNIDTQGHYETRSLVAENCNNIIISGNNIKSSSDSHLASALHVVGETTAVVDNNNISATSPEVTYPVYVDEWFTDLGQANITNNNIKGEADTVYGIYAEENKTIIANNDLEVNGNHVYGIVTHQTDVIIDGNNITANGKDTGSIVSPQSGVNENTTGIIVSGGNVEITNNNVVTNGKSTIAVINTNATINNNGLTANGTTANDTISNKNSNVISANNTEARNKTENVTPDTPVIPVKPVEPVVKITAKNNAKVDYGFIYKVQVTQDGKSVGAGKQVTLKIAGKTLNAKTDKNGYATFKLTVKPKKYTVTVTYDKVTQNYKLTVKNVIKAKNVKVKKSAKKAKIKVTLKTSSKKPIKGKKIILKIKGKKIKAKTNKKGVATFKI
ncbi:beta strand repeat-containing protein, partial [Methanobrevibacter sp.]